jgi:large subunit ribosomal protein L2
VVVDVTQSSVKNKFFALVKYVSGSYNYILLPYGAWFGSLIGYLKTRDNYYLYFFCFTKIYILKYFKNIIGPIGKLFSSAIIFNVSTRTELSGKYAIACGTFCKIIHIYKFKKITLIELPTKIRRLISSDSVVTSGRVANRLHSSECFGKAGSNRLINIRPTVRGVAMNPVDHPHGGRTKTNSPEVTP